ncbi:hypothetical protein MHBO_000834 [Bonamia ostreae]|uniref:DENR N-terminal domain-containing protein n=1 Tax=Bonamia ostreae TaxID=126728 RepID=A0ABV2AGZ8_9EUKA
MIKLLLKKSILNDNHTKNRVCKIFARNFADFPGIRDDKGNLLEPNFYCKVCTLPFEYCKYSVNLNKCVDSRENYRIFLERINFNQKVATQITNLCKLPFFSVKSVLALLRKNLQCNSVYKKQIYVMFRDEKKISFVLNEHLGIPKENIFVVENNKHKPAFNKDGVFAYKDDFVYD